MKQTRVSMPWWWWALLGWALVTTPFGLTNWLLLQLSILAVLLLGDTRRIVHRVR
jgi:hypothetical protein